MADTLEAKPEDAAVAGTSKMTSSQIDLLSNVTSQTAPAPPVNPPDSRRWKNPFKDVRRVLL